MASRFMIASILLSLWSAWMLWIAYQVLFQSSN